MLLIPSILYLAAIITFIIILIKLGKSKHNLKTFKYLEENIKWWRILKAEFEGLERIGTSISNYMLNSNEPDIFYKSRGDK